MSSANDLALYCFVVSPFLPKTTFYYFSRQWKKVFLYLKTTTTELKATQKCMHSLAHNNRTHAHTKHVICSFVSRNLDNKKKFLSFKLINMH